MAVKKSIAIIGEGETEWWYFETLRVACRYKFKVAPDFPQHSDIPHMAKLAEDYVKRETDYVVCLVDMDRLLRVPAEMAVYQLEKVMERQLLDGHTVQLGELGSFSLTITGEACRGEKEVTPDKIKKVNLRFRAGKGIKAALAEAKLRPAEDMLSKKK